MAASATVLFAKPQHEIASAISQQISDSSKVQIVTGFATEAGVQAIESPLLGDPKKLECFIVGAGTGGAFKSLGRLINGGVSSSSLYVHLGHTRLKKPGSPDNFYHYHPMLHTKVFYFELPNSRACAFVGSHNVTSFALCGSNGEMAVRLDGNRMDPEFEAIRQHIDEARAQSVPYNTEMCEAYEWWTQVYLNALITTEALPTTSRSKRTIIILAEINSVEWPIAGEAIYFEIPKGIKQISSTKTKAHVFLFEKLPSTPEEALKMRHFAKASWTGPVVGLDNAKGNVETIAHWHINNTKHPVLLRVENSRLVPRTPDGMQQVRIELDSRGVSKNEYGFDKEGYFWRPELTGEHVPPGNTNCSPWSLVQGFSRIEGKAADDQSALDLVKPSAGSFILVSTHLAKLRNNQKKQISR